MIKIFVDPNLKPTVEILFQKCVKDLEGKRKVRIMPLEEYNKIQAEELKIVDEDENEDSGFLVSDFFKSLGPYRDDMILVYSHMLDSTQTFMNTYCNNMVNIVCCTDIQTQGRGNSFSITQGKDERQMPGYPL